ncbi:MAG: outer-membrane lipoprotein carrier protein LolA [Spirochaetota bacterium]|nr:outer-membrane lipoprotein carrier protein LolA [Spirochaetota bacterium]
MKHIIVSIFVLFFLTPTLTGKKYKFEFITVSDIVKRVKKKFSEIESYQANFIITTTKLESKSNQSGLVMYKAPSKIRIEFYVPYGQKVISNGQTMWIYIPSMNVVAEQDLKSDNNSLFLTGTKSGLNRLFQKYHYKFASKKQPNEQSDGTMNYTLILKQRESRSGFRNLKLWIDENYIITQAHGETSTGKSVKIQLANIKTDVDITNGKFHFDIPSKARIIKNPIISEE